MSDSGKPPPPTPAPATAPATAARGGVAVGVPAQHSVRPTPQPFTTFGPTPPSSSLHQARGSIGSFSSLNSRPNSVPSSQSQRLGQTPFRAGPTGQSSSAFNSQRNLPSSSLMQHHMHSTIPSPFRPSQQQTSQQQNPSLQQHRPIQTLQQQQRPFQNPLPHLQATPPNPSFPPQNPNFPAQNPSFPAQNPSFPAQNPSFPAQNPNPNRVPISGPIGPIGLVGSDASEQGDRIVTKRSIHELFNQVNPLEKVEEEVEEVLIDVAEEFVESLTKFACSLAKHRKSSTLEAKDILLHAERNWNITLPGFSGDELKMYKKQNVNDIHRERLALIKKSMGDPRRAYLISPPAPQNKP